MAEESGVYVTACELPFFGWLHLRKRNDSGFRGFYASRLKVA